MLFINQFPSTDSFNHHGHYTNIINFTAAVLMAEGENSEIHTNQHESGQKKSVTEMNLEVDLVQSPRKTW